MRKFEVTLEFEVEVFAEDHDEALERAMRKVQELHIPYDVTAVHAMDLGEEDE